MIINFFTVPVILFYIVNGFLYLFYAIKLKKNFQNEHNILNSSVVIFLWFLAALLYPFFFRDDSIHGKFFQSLAMQIICIYASLLVFFILFLQYEFKIRKHPELKSERTMESFLEKFNDYTKLQEKNASHSFKTDFHRKIFHIIPACVIIGLWFFATDVWADIYHADLIWGISGEDYAIFLIITVGYTAIIIFAALDYIRLSYIFKKRTIFHLLPQCLSNFLIRTVKKSELRDFTKPVALILSYVPIFFLPMGVFTASALIASIGDGMASLMGIKFGKRNFPKNSCKTIVGYVAGTVSSFIVSIISLMIFEPTLNINKIFLIAIGGSLTYLLIDILSLKIDDNILNPIFCGFVMGLLYYIL
ncbi:MAG: hypothetical protein ACTSUL_01795 [Promethearchaeota archaeon]